MLLESKDTHHLNQCTCIIHQDFSKYATSVKTQTLFTGKIYSLDFCWTGAVIAAVAAQVVVAAAAAAVMAAVVVASVAAAAAAVVAVAANEWSTRNILFQHMIVTLTFFALSINFCGCPIIVSRSAKKQPTSKSKIKLICQLQSLTKFTTRLFKNVNKREIT